jgi:hypothetical protein
MSFGILKRIPLEAAIWLAGLVYLASLKTGGSHLTICPFSNSGFDFCPGCGLGMSITLLFHGHIIDSLRAHPLGIFAVIVLSFRIIRLTKHHLQYYGKSN